ncbi:MAG: hypothetical protein RIB93_01900 [Coleofasciculus sp. D1-CHI-01]
MKDRRWLNRQKAGDIAERSLNNLKNNGKVPEYSAHKPNLSC